MRSLLHDYLATDGEASYRGGQGQASAGSAFSRAPRDKTKRMFKLSDINTKSPDIAQEVLGAWSCFRVEETRRHGDRL
jgi:exocyst complex component 4